MRTYRVLAHLIAACAVLQAMWIALGNFTMFHSLEDGTVLDSSYHGSYPEIMHGTFGIGVIPLLAIALFITSFFTTVPGGTKWAGFVLLDVVLQIGLVFLAYSIPIFGAVHGVNAFAVLILAELTARRAVPSVTPETDLLTPQRSAPQ